MMQNCRFIRFLPSSRLWAAALCSLLLLTGCRGFFIGKENLSEPVVLEKTNGNILKQVWKTKVGDGENLRALTLLPWFYNDTLFVVSEDGVLAAVDFEQGKTHWKKTIGQRISAGISGDATHLFVGTREGVLQAYNHDGKLLWQKNLGSEMLAAPTVVGGLVVTRTLSGQVNALTVDGKMVWEQTIGTNPLSIRANARALFVDGAFWLVDNKGHLSIFDGKTGQRQLDVPLVFGRGLTAVLRLSDLVATPVVRNGLLFVSAYRHETLALDLKSGDLRWRAPIGSALDLFADSNAVYVVDKDSVIYALNQADGQLLWQSEAARGHRLSALAGNGQYLLAMDYLGQALLFSAFDGHLLDVKSVASDDEIRTYAAPQCTKTDCIIYAADGTLLRLQLAE